MHGSLSPSTNFTEWCRCYSQQLPSSAPSFDGGLMIQSSTSFSLTIPYLYSDQYEFCISPTSNAVSGTRYYFRIQGGVGSGYDRIPSTVYTGPVLTFGSNKHWVHDGNTEWECECTEPEHDRTVLVRYKFGKLQRQRPWSP